MARAYPLQRKPLRTSTNPIAVWLGLFDLWRRRDLLWHMTVRHLRGQYKQSVLGYAWAFVNPLSQMVIMSFVFSTILHVGSQNNEPYPLFLFVGLVPWLFFSSALASGTDAVTGAASLVTKVYFPREVLPTAAVFTKLVDLFFGFVILGMLMVYYGTLPAATVYWFPLLFAIHMIFVLGLVYPLCALNLYYHDVRFLVGVVLTLWFYLTPVLYPLDDRVPHRYQWIYDINPNAVLIDAYRRVILYGNDPDWKKVGLGAIIAVGTFLLGYYIFKRMEAGFADSI
ncbi:MAG: ABC transporter permease [Chloroflexota bacterium]